MLFFSLKDDLEMAHFVTQYLTYLLVFILGLKAPGLRRSRDYSLFNDPDDRRQSNGSTFRNFRKKVRLLASFLIPAKSKWLQCRVFICFLLLLSGRVINVFVPIYNKLIGNLFTEILFSFNIQGRPDLTVRTSPSYRKTNLNNFYSFHFFCIGLDF